MFANWRRFKHFLLFAFLVILVFAIMLLGQSDYEQETYFSIDQTSHNITDVTNDAIYTDQETKETFEKDDAYSLSVSITMHLHITKGEKGKDKDKQFSDQPDPEEIEVLSDSRVIPSTKTDKHRGTEYEIKTEEKANSSHVYKQAIQNDVYNLQYNSNTTGGPGEESTSASTDVFKKSTVPLSESQLIDDSMKTVLWYDTHEKSMGSHTTTIGFSQCEYKNCQYKSYLSRTDTKPKRPFDADAILIQSAGIWDLSPPPRRDENQVFVLAVRDSFPRTTANRDSGMGMKWVDVFNWTMTYRLDSDIVFKYANIVERENKSFIASKNYDRIFEEKNNKAVWFVSHCRTNSMREHYVREMQKTMDVDIFGRCGAPPPCPKMSDNIDQCIDKIALKYKFYLAFENTFVEDYVTEKVFRWFNRDIIVVARGGSNYSKILPPGTVVDAGDFKSSSELGKYLKELAKDKKRYTEYLKRKDQYYSTNKMVPAQEANCKLCEYLNNLDSHRMSYDNIINWWLRNWRNYDMKPTDLKGWPR